MAADSRADLVFDFHLEGSRHIVSVDELFLYFPGRLHERWSVRFFLRMWPSYGRSDG